MEGKRPKCADGVVEFGELEVKERLGTSWGVGGGYLKSFVRLFERGRETLRMEGVDWSCLLDSEVAGEL